MKNLIILAEFPDIPHTYTQAQFNSLFNQVGYSFDGAVGSVKDYYHEISYNKLTIQSTVSQWVTLPHGYVYYGANNPSDPYSPKSVNVREMVTDAINALAVTGFDFSTVDGNNDGEVDGLTIIHSGRGEEVQGNNPNYIWSHQGQLAAPISKNGVTMQMYHTEPEMRGADATPASWGISRIGVIAHETGHFLGLPDLYDTTGASSGVGEFCLMSGGSWGGGDGRSPVHMSAWCKAVLGWATPTQISTRGNYSLPRIEDNDTAMYLLQAGAFPSSEAFLVENRQGYGFDGGLPGSNRGILIWHVDNRKFWDGNNTDPTHYLVELKEASGIQHLELAPNISGDDNDFFRLGNNAVFGDTTTPNSLSYSGNKLGLLIQNISASGNTMTFDSVVTEVSQLSLGTLKAYPNPCFFNLSNLTIKGIPADAAEVKVYVYTTAGGLVRVLEKDDGVGGDNTVTWDGKNKSGLKAASGLYIYLVKTSNYGSATGKFYVLW